tara:strand:- start:190 stop:360 length:171 start_codon:yes stop_codon:yes gene_type:complete
MALQPMFADISIAVKQLMALNPLLNETITSHNTSANFAAKMIHVPHFRQDSYPAHF